MKKKLLSTGLIAGSLALAVSVGAYAGANLEEVKALLNKGIKIELNGSTIDLKDEQGGILYPITYEGNTYLPVRAIGTNLGLDVAWDGSANKVILSNGTEQPSQEGPKQEAPAEVEYKAGQFIFRDVTATDSRFGWDVVAEVENSGDNTISAAVFTVTFTDSSGKRIGTASGSVSDLGPGDTKTIQFTTLDELDGYAGIKFQVDASF